jgi:hypothetical protein
MQIDLLRPSVPRELGGGQKLSRTVGTKKDLLPSCHQLAI